MRRTFGPSGGNRKPAVAAPGSSGSSRPTKQLGGGGSKGTQGTPEANYLTTPTVTVSSTGSVTTSGYQPKAARRAKRAARASRKRERRITKAVSISRQNASQRRRKQATDTKRLARTETAIKATRPKLASTPKSFKGKPTAGTPTLKSLQTAAKSGALKTNRKGFVTTPPVRKAARELKQAKKAVRKTTGLTGPLTPGQKKFSRIVARKTGLSPRVIAAQALAEESGSYAQQREAEGNHNWLNIGYFDSGPGEITRDPTWSNPKSAAKATARFYNNQEFGPSEKIAAIVPTSAGKSDAAQIAAIGNSDWATSGAYRESIEGTHDLIGQKRNPKAVKRLQRAEADAKSLGLKPSSTPKASKKLVTRFKAAKQAMKEVEGLPYVWGGGHGSPTSSPTGGGLDCSGAVGYVLNKIGALKGSLTSGDMGSVLKPGPGALTVFYNGEHTFLRLGNEYWGTSVGDSGSGGLGPHPTPSASYLAQYNVGHVSGMGLKQARELGFKNLGATQSFPGMTLSSSGTTATINEGAGATKEGKPGFSQKPIKLTQAQKAHRKFRRLDELGVGESEAARSESPTLKALEQKYGVAA
jgi:hypothetical protein